MKMSPMALKIYQSGFKILPKKNYPQNIALHFKDFAKMAKHRQIWSHCVKCLHWTQSTSK